MPSPVRRADDIEEVITGLSGKPGGGLVVMPDTFTSTLSVYNMIIALTARHRVPAIYPYRYMAASGGLLSYGTDNGDLFRRAATYIDRVLKGAKPAELPVQLPTKFEFVINMKTAQAMGIEIPLKLRTFADEVIE
jgi:putative ABC transport system substrate-binding protein